MSYRHKSAHNDLSAEFVREVFSYDPETGDLRWKNRLSRRVREGDVAGVLDDQGRRKIGIYNKDYFAHRIIWLFVTGQWPKFEIDHRDLNKSNNRWYNLREATSEQNQRNRPKQKNNTSGYKGVCETYPGSGSWMAGIKIKGKRRHLGCFPTREEASTAYQIAARLVSGEFNHES